MWAFLTYELTGILHSCHVRDGVGTASLALGDISVLFFLWVSDVEISGITADDVSVLANTDDKKLLLMLS